MKTNAVACCTLQVQRSTNNTTKFKFRHSHHNTFGSASKAVCAYVAMDVEKWAWWPSFCNCVQLWTARWAYMPSICSWVGFTKEKKINKQNQQI